MQFQHLGHGLVKLLFAVPYGIVSVDALGGCHHIPAAKLPFNTVHGSSILAQSAHDGTWNLVIWDVVVVVFDASHD